MDLVLINMDYSLLQFDALKVVLGFRLHWGSLPKHFFFQYKPLDNKIAYTDQIA